MSDMAKLHDDVDEYLQAFYSRACDVAFSPEPIVSLTNCGSIDDNEKKGRGNEI